MREDDWKGEHLIRAPEKPKVKKRDEYAAIRSAASEGLTLTEAAHKLGMKRKDLQQTANALRVRFARYSKGRFQ